MLQTVTELFLDTYFLFDAIAGKLFGERKLLFDKLYSAFLLPEKERKKLFSATQANVVSEVKTYEDYARMCRIRKFSSLTESPIDDGFYETLAVKGGALKKIKQLKFDEYLGGTETAVCKFLSDTADMGFVSSLCLLGFLQCEGIFVPRNEKHGRKNLEKAAQWNCIEGILLALAYDEGNRQKNANRLYTVTRGTLYDGMSQAAQAAYGLNDLKKVPESRLLQKAFGANILKPELYIKQFARLIFSDVLSLKDKEGVLFSGNQGTVAETADLPLKLSPGDLPFSKQAMEELPLTREKELGGILNCALGFDMRRDSAYRPLCVSGDSEYLLKLYLSAIGKAFSSAHVERIDVADLNEYDFEPTKNNVFVRSCDEDKENVYLLYFKGEISERVLTAAKNFLNGDKRRKFRLQRPSLDIDLSAVLPVCFADRQNAAGLKALCDVVTLAPVSATEKPDLLAYIRKVKAKQYKMKSVKFDDAAQKALASYCVERAESLVDKAVRTHRRADSLTITAAMLGEIAGGEAETRAHYGFGGAGNESE